MKNATTQKSTYYATVEKVLWNSGHFNAEYGNNTDYKQTIIDENLLKQLAFYSALLLREL